MDSNMPKQVDATTAAKAPSGNNSKEDFLSHRLQQKQRVYVNQASEMLLFLPQTVPCYIKY